MQSCIVELPSEHIVRCMQTQTSQTITNTMEPRTRWGICLGPTGNLQGSYIFMTLATGKRIVRRKFTETPITNRVKKQVAKWASKDCAITGLKFMDEYRIKYKFNKEEDTIIEENPIDMVSYPDVSAEAPGIMTQYENLIDGENVIEDKPVLRDKEQAMMVAENSVLEFETVGESRAAGKAIELLDYDESNMLDNDIKHDKEIRVKGEPQLAKITAKNEDDENEDHTHKTAEEQPRRLGRG